MRMGRCECSDRGCKDHAGVNECLNKAKVVLHRIDMEDESGTAFCDWCADDAFEAGMFAMKDEVTR